MSNGLVKGLLKGLKYISQIFDSEKEVEMQIGHPTDVKHVAHIGWEGPSVNSPNWMNRFKKQPLGDSWMSQDHGRRGSNSAAHCPAGVPKSSRRSSSIESPTAGERSNRPKARRSSKSKSSDQKQTTDQTDSPTLTQPNIPRTGRRKKTTSRSKVQVADTYNSPLSEPRFMSKTESMSISNDSSLCKNIEGES